MVFLKHLPDGSFAVVFESFSAQSADHINVVLVPSHDVMATTDVDPTMLLDLGPLKGTSGMQDYTIPAAMAGNAMSYGSVVIWDTAMKHALGAAALK